MNRILTANVLLKSNEDQINKLINNENTNALILVVAEPILMRDGKTYLSTYGNFIIEVENYNQLFIEIQPL